MFGVARVLGTFFAFILSACLVVPGVSLAATTSFTATLCPGTLAVSLVSDTPNPTTGSTAHVFGVSQYGATVTIMVNSLASAVLVVAPDGSYDANVPLNIGSNTLNAQASDSCSRTATSPAINLVRTTVPPLPPTITNPPNGSTVHVPSIQVDGTAESGTSVSLYRNGTLVGTVVATASGQFGLLIVLVAGTNSLTATATNSVGTSPSSLPVMVSFALAAPVNPSYPSLPAIYPQITSP